MGRGHIGGIVGAAGAEIDALRRLQFAIDQPAGGVDQQIVDRYPDAQPCGAEPVDRLARGKGAIGTGREAGQRDRAADILRTADAAPLRIAFKADYQRRAGP
jgi:hypothetical protein